MKIFNVKICSFLLVILACQIAKSQAPNTYVSVSSGSNAGTNAVVNNFNVGIGWNTQNYASMYPSSSITGSLNVSVGNNSLWSLTSGVGNCAIGFDALFGVSTQDDNVGIGNRAGQGVSGNENIAIGTEVLSGGGTVNNCIGLGYYSLHHNMGGDNVAVGVQALEYNNTGTFNVAIGELAMDGNSKGNYNTVVGHNALFYSQNCSQNTIVGYQAAYNSNAAAYNDVFGYQALFKNTTGDYNVAMGNSVLYSNTSGSGNIGIGPFALNKVTSGSYLTAIGTNALQNYSAGGRNTSVGFQSMENATAGENNTAMGFLAGSSYATYNQITLLGDETETDVTGRTNSSAVGYYARISANNEVVLGNTSTTDVWGGSYHIVSDKRFKKDVQENVPGIAFIKSLRPVTYHYDMNALDKTIYGKDAEEYEKKMAKEIEKKGAILYTGFIAQEVLAAANKVGYNFSGVKVPQEGEKDMYGLSYSDFVVPLVKSVQEQEAIIETQSNKIASLENNLSAVLTRLDVVSNQLNALRECCNSSSAEPSSGATNGNINGSAISQLFDAMPNPSSSSTVLPYFISTTFTSAEIQLSDMNGQVIKTIPIQSTGYSSVELQTNTLAPTTYNYSLVVDGKVVNTKKLSVVSK